MEQIQTALIIIFSLGAIFPILVLLKMRSVNKFKKNGVITVANVINQEKRTGHKGAVYYIWTVQYRDSTGKLHRGTTIGYLPNAVGMTMPVIYKASDPRIFRTEFGKNLKKMLIIACVFFAIMIGVCIWLISETREYYSN